MKVEVWQDLFTTLIVCASQIIARLKSNQIGMRLIY